MPGNPKDPNAWWALKTPLPEMLPNNLSERQKKQVFWIRVIYLLFLAITIPIGVYVLVKFQHMR